MGDRFDVPQDPGFSWRFIGRRLVRSPKRGTVRHELFLARNAIFHAVRLLGIRRGQTVLVPSYVCRAAIEPILAQGVNIEFYTVGRACDIDFSDIENRIHADTAAILAIHYFGFPAAIDRLRAVCDEHGMFLIEDCAHVLFGETQGRSLGDFGDVSVFSWRKFIPVYDGMTLCINSQKFQLPSEIKNAPISLELRAVRRITPDFSRLKNAIGIGVSQSGPPAGPRSASEIAGNDPFETNTDEFRIQSANFKMSRISRLVMEHSDVAAIVAVRKANFEKLSQRLESVPGVTCLHAHPPSNGAAWVFPVIFDKHRDAHKSLREIGIPAAAWDGVRPSGLDDAYPDADFLYHHLVFLPVHQGLRNEHLDKIASAVNDVASHVTKDRLVDM